MHRSAIANPGGRGAARPTAARRLAVRRQLSHARGERLTDEVAKAGYLRTVQDWIIRPQLRTVAGVAGVDLDRRLREAVSSSSPIRSTCSNYGVSFSELGEALETANLAVGANFFKPRRGRPISVRADARDPLGRGDLRTPQWRHSRRRARSLVATVADGRRSAVICVPVPPA